MQWTIELTSKGIRYSWDPFLLLVLSPKGDGLRADPVNLYIPVQPKSKSFRGSSAKSHRMRNDYAQSPLFKTYGS